MVGSDRKTSQTRREGGREGEEERERERERLAHVTGREGPSNQNI